MSDGQNKSKNVWVPLGSDGYLDMDKMLKIGFQKAWMVLRHPCGLKLDASLSGATYYTGAIFDMKCQFWPESEKDLIALIRMLSREKT